VVAPEAARAVAERVVEQLDAQGVRVARWVESPVRGGKGNCEFFLKVDAE
jgi:predicted rRNA methylase YqxC with S4 and FtsJ domains